MTTGAIWMTLLRFTYRIIGLVSTVILARLLTTDDFGIAAIAMSIFAIINIFSQFGFDTVLIQKNNASEYDYNTAWTFNFIFGAVSAVFLFLLSPFVADFYQNEDLGAITKVIAFMFLLHGFRNIGVVDFQKNLTFDKEFKLHVMPKFISFFITIGLALYYENYWALVIGNVAWKLIEVINSYLMHPFRPKFCFKSSAELFGFSKWLMGNNFLNVINNRSPELILGKFISPHAAAIFNLASEIGQMATSEIIANLNRAIYPGYAKVSNNLDELRPLYLGSIRVIAFIAMPLGAGLALVAHYVVPLMLGEQWFDAIEPLIYIALAGSLYALKSNSNYVYFAIGKPRIATFELAIRAVFFLTTMYFLVKMNGVVGATQSFLITAILMFVVSNLIMKFALGVGFRKQTIIYTKPFISTLIMSFSVYIYTSTTVLENMFINLLVSVVIGAFSYLISVYLVWLLSGKKDGVELQAFNFISLKLQR